MFTRAARTAMRRADGDEDRAGLVEDAQGLAPRVREAAELLVEAGVAQGAELRVDG